MQSRINREVAGQVIYTPIIFCQGHPIHSMELCGPRVNVTQKKWSLSPHGLIMRSLQNNGWLATTILRTRPLIACVSVNNNILCYACTSRAIYHFLCSIVIAKNLFYKYSSNSNLTVKYFFLNNCRDDNSTGSCVLWSSLHYNLTLQLIMCCPYQSFVMAGDPCKKNSLGCLCFSWSKWKTVMVLFT